MTAEMAMAWDCVATADCMVYGEGCGDGYGNSHGCGGGGHGYGYGHNYNYNYGYSCGKGHKDRPTRQAIALLEPRQ